MIASYCDVFDHYKTGVINDDSLCPSNVDHGVTAVGYTSKYYIIKNSWGPNWGENGFGKVAITGDGDGVMMIQNWCMTPYTL